MKITILNGSPKGARSVTMQYVNYLEKVYPEHRFEYVNAAQKCRLFEKNEAAFNKVMDTIASADAVLWAFPLYFLVVQSQYKRFIELIFERGRQDVFRNKYTAALSTSIHFADHIAHNYIRGICDDLGMRHVDFFPASMHDLMEESKRNALTAFFSRLLHYAENGIPVRPSSAPLSPRDLTYRPSGGPLPVDTAKKVVVVADIEDAGSSLAGMVNRFRANFRESDLVNLRELRMGNCTGCLKCGLDNQCAYEGSADEYIAMYREKVLTADIVVFANTVHDRCMSSYWHRYLERSFMRTHQPVLTGKQIVYLVSGPFSQDHNMREFLQMYAETMQGNVVRYVTDEAGDSPELDRVIDAAARDAVFLSEADARRPLTFLGVGGMKIFRDDIYGGLRFVFQADDRYFRRHGLYDFPQKKHFFNLMITLLMGLSRLPFLRERIRRSMTRQMLTPYKKVLSAADPSLREGFEHAGETGRPSLAAGGPSAA